MGYYSDLGTGTVHHVDKLTGLPATESGILLDPYTDDGEKAKDWNKPGKELVNLTSPYGFLEFAIGSGDDFYCFDYTISGSFLILHSVINSETASFIQRGDYKVIDLDDPCGYDYQALEMIGEALDWVCDEPPVRCTKKGWNQDFYYFHRCVHLAVARHRGENPPNFSDREKRWGGKRINKFCGIEGR